MDTRKAFEPIQVMPKIKDAAPPPPKKSRPPLIMKYVINQDLILCVDFAEWLSSYYSDSFFLFKYMYHL